MFEMPATTFFAQMKKVITKTMNDHGLEVVTDVDQHTSGLPFGLGDVDMTYEEKEEFDDRPAIDKVLNLLFKAKSKDPVAQTCRLIGVLPDTCSAVVRVAISYIPADPDDAMDLDVHGAVEMKATGGVRKMHDHVTTADASQVRGALEKITSLCQDAQQTYKLKPIGPEIGGYIGGGFGPAPMPQILSDG